MARRAALIPVVALVVGLAGCDRGEMDDVPEKITGVVVEIDSAGLGDVDGFTIKRRSETFQIHIDESIDYSFPVGHLHQHRTGAEPVTVEIEKRGDDLYATSIADG